MELLLIAPVGAEPLVARLPDHAPEAVQLVVFVLFQASVLLPPLGTEVGFALNVSVGAGAAVTFTVALLDAVPPEPVHVRVNVDVLFRAPVEADPLVARLPDQAPDAVQLVALVLLHESVLLLPLETVVGFAVKVTVGAGELCTATVTLREINPPAPLQLSE